MADQVTVDNSTNGDYVVSTDDAGASGQVQRVKLTYSADGDATHIPADADGLLVNLGANNDVTIADGGNSITVDDGGSSITVDGTVGVSGTVTVDSELTTGDLDTGAGTDTRAVVGLVGSKSGGGEIIPGDASNGLLVNLGANNDVTVTGTVTVDASGTAVPITDNSGSLTVDDGGSSLTVDGTVTANLAAGTNNIGDVDVLTVPAPLSTTGGGTEATALRVTIASDSTGVVSVDDNGGALTVDNGGTFAVQVDGSALTALQKIDDPVLVDDAAFTPATSSVMMAGFEADESSTDSVDEGDAGAGRMTLDRKVIVNPQPHTAGGLSIFRSLDLDETEEEAKATAGQVYGWFIANTATSTRFVKFYNATAANVTVGTTTPVMTLPIPGNSSDDVAAHVMGAHGIVFDTAITVAATTGVADNDTGAPAANDVIINVFYK